MSFIRIKFLCLLLLLSIQGFSDVTLPALIGHHMVLQRDVKLMIWGWADKGEKIAVQFNKKNFHTITNANGKWMITFGPMPAGGPYNMEITGKNKITLNDILIGDVWFCSGQSNMVLTMERVKEKYPEEVANASFSEIRNFFVPTASDVKGPHRDLPPGQWLLCTSDNVLRFGAVSYFFARKIYQQHHVPIGIINSSVGGTPVEAWISEEGFSQLPRFSEMIKNFKDSSYMNKVQKIARTNTNQPRPVFEPDKGRTGPVAWNNPAYVPKGWHNFWMPGYWEDQGVKGLNGVLWFRKEIDVPESMTGKPAKLFLGRIVDADSAFVNGTFVGAITYQYPPRRYELSSQMLKAGKNVIVVRVVNSAGKGGFVPDKNYSLVAGGLTIDLRGNWQCQVGQVFPPTQRTVINPSFSAQNSPTGLYNTMVAPAINYRIKGFAWYQGESNAGRPDEYEELLTALIRDWRNKWQKQDLPFFFVQLPGFMEVQYSPSESNWAVLRNRQRKVLSVPNTAMIVTLELGEWNDIHPLTKKEIGDRLALAAEHFAYGDQKVVYSGPLYASHKIDGNKIILTFNHTGSGLVTKDGEELKCFSIAGADKKYVWAKAKIDGETIVVWNDNIKDPVSVRYAWADNPEGANLYNKEGLPASPFETDTNK